MTDSRFKNTSLGMIPSHWEVKELGDLCDVKGRIGWRGYTVKDLRTYGPLVIGAKQITKDNRLDFSNSTHISWEKYQESPEIQIERNDILIVKVGNTIGKVAIVKKDIGEACINPNTVLLKRSQIEPYFLFCHLISNYGQHFLISNSSASAQPAINQATIKKLNIPVPPSSEQKAIARILGTLDDKIELNQQMNRTLEATARAIFKSWFVDFDPVRALIDGRQPEGMDAETAALFPAAFEDSELGMIPQGWRVNTLNECTSLIIDYRGKTPKKLGKDWSSSGIPAISAKNIKSGKMIRKDVIRYVDEELFKRWMKDRLAIGDIIMTSEAPLGELFYLALNANFCLSQRLYGIRANSSICKSIYLYYALGTEEVQTDIKSRATGSTVLGIRQTELRKVKILLPPIKIQQKAKFRLEQYITKIHLNCEENEVLANLRDTLLPKLMSGEIRVVEAEKMVEDVT